LLELERLEGNVVGGDQQFAGEGAFRGPAPHRFFGGEQYEIRITALLGKAPLLSSRAQRGICLFFSAMKSRALPPLACVRVREA